MLSYHELNVFVQAALVENFSLAARRLYLSQPAVSLQISNLEKRLGLELFTRNGRSIQLNEAGRTLLPLAQEALRHAKQIEETMSALHGLMIGHLTIACSTTVGKYILPRLVAGFRRKYPEVRVTINIMSRRAAVEWLLDDRAELSVVSAPPSPGEIVCSQFLEDQIELIVPADHAWADGRTVQPADLLTQPFILREPMAGTYEVLAEALAAHQIEINQLQTVLTLANAEAIEMSVEEGIGIAFVSRLAAERGLQLGRIKAVPVQGMSLTRAIYMLRRRNRATTPLQQAFWDFVFAPENAMLRQLSQP